MCLLAFSLYPYVRLYNLAGRGAQILRGNHKRGARSAPSSLILSPLLRFPLRLSFLISPLSWGAPHPFVCWAFSALRIVPFTRCEWGHLPNGLPVLSAGFRTGSNKAKEAAPRRLLRKLGVLRPPSPEGNARGSSPQKPRSAACNKENWERFAHRPRRKSAVGPADRLDILGHKGV